MINTMLTSLSDERIRAFRAAGHWRESTIYALVREHADHTPEKVAVRERDRQVTYAELVDAADRLAATLHGHRVRPGQRVAVWLPSRIETVVALLACSRNGYVACPSLHRDHTVGEIVELLARMRAAALIAEVGYGADADRHDVFAEVRGLAGLRLVLALPPRDQTAAVLPDLPAPAATAAIRTDPDTIVYLAFTSGTTGAPKGVMHSDNTLLAPARAMAADWSLDAGMCVYSLSPLSHNLGLGAMIMTLTGGGEFVVHDLPRGESLADRLREVGATFVFGVPTHAIDLLAELRERPGTGLPSVRGFRVSGAPVPPVVAQGLLDLGVVPQSGYGMTEAGSHHYTVPDDDPTLIVESSGRACAGYEVAIFSREDPEQVLPPGEVGQIGARGASLMLGYFDDQAATEDAFNADGWFMTGDLGWMDEAGYLRITGRKKDVIIRGGHNIFPAKIENFAMRHDGVDKAAVIGVPDERLGERVCLIVKPMPHQHVDAEQMLRHLDESGLSKFDMPEYFVALDDIPLMPSGKILKRRLVEWLDEGRVTPSPVRFTPAARA
ncbi:class I adenylate-forming enzyme family protein [Pseudonocardia sp. H11422]|uniref:class I adenylate-forming enzyme family protein n=1 Tax=Pseudonocardia sp. H11422 TaxID=2835866 RepID=UPI001BDC854C|nr:class I adenylate-forming enzyme family protein [Pseudonocardia sp. H11422]